MMTSEKDEAAVAAQVDAQQSQQAQAPAKEPAAATPNATNAANSTNAAPAPAPAEVEAKPAGDAPAPVAAAAAAAAAAAPVANSETAAESKPAAEAAAPAKEAAPAPRMVKSVVLTGYGNVEKLKVKQWPLAAAPAAGQVEVSVAACGLNFGDLCVRRGVLRDRGASPPFVMGVECAGTVSALGEGVEGLQVGDKVVCYQHTGDLYRETVVLAASHVFRLPDAVPVETGAALLVNYLTAYFSLLEVGNLRAGQSVLIHSCGGGVGWAATQLARTVEGVTVFGTASSSKHEAVTANGVTHALNPESYDQELLKINPQGVDIIIDNQAGTSVSASLRLLKPLGRVIIIGMNNLMAGQRSGFVDMVRALWNTKGVSTLDLVTGNRAVAGLHLGRLMEQDPERFRTALDLVFKMYADKRIVPRIDSEWPLEKVVDATKHLAERKSIGKILLKINAETENTESQKSEKSETQKTETQKS